MPVAESPQWLSRPYRLNAKLSKAVRSGNIEAAREVLDENSNLLVNDFNSNCETPLIIACRRGDIEMVKFLLEKGADPGFTPPVPFCHTTAMQEAKKADKGKIIRLLEEAWQQRCRND